MATDCIIGIDPGPGGGLSAIDIVQGVVADKMPESHRDLFELLYHSYRNMGSSVVAFVEKVNAGPKMGSSAAFKFGQSVGSIHMACIASGIRMELVSPQKWQKELGLIVSGRGLGQGDTEKKNRNKARAQELFPGLKITHAIADALLIAEYGWRQYRNKSGLAAIMGKWPGDETDEEIAAALEEIS